MIQQTLAALMLAPALLGAGEGEDSRALTRRLDRQQVASLELPVGEGTLVVTPAWGARVMGAYFKGDPLNVFWVPPDFDDQLPPWWWNKGGTRTWLAPEGSPKGFFYDRNWENWDVPSTFDPGHYKPVAPRDGGKAAFETFVLATANDGTKHRLTLSREFVPVADPADSGVAFVGFKTAHRLRNVGPRALKNEVSLWHLAQFRGRSTVVFPLAPGDQVTYTDQFEPTPKERITVTPEAIFYRVGEPPRYKIGVPATRSLGRVGAFSLLPDGRLQLVVNRYAVDPKGVYLDKARNAGDVNGDAFQSYNHDQDGAQHFFELESHHPAVVLAPGEEQQVDVEYLVYRGDRDRVTAAGAKLLGVDLSPLGEVAR